MILIMPPDKKIARHQPNFSFFFHDSWETNYWLPYLKMISGIKLEMHTKEIIFQELESGALKELLDLLKNFLILNQTVITNNDQDICKMILPIKVMVPSLTFESFRAIMINWYNIHHGNNKKDYLYQSISDKILHAYLNQIKIISKLSDPLWKLVNKLKQETKFDRVTRILKELSESETWGDFLIQNKPFETSEISLNRWLHILRHPTKASIYLHEFLIKSKITGLEPTIIESFLPLINPLDQKMLLITILENETKSNEIPIEIKQYWLTLGAILLRNISNALFRIDEIINLEPKSKDYYIQLKGKLKGKLQKFIESCTNKDVIEAYKQYNNIIQDNLTTSFLRNYEFNMYNRGWLMKKRLKQAVNEFNNFPSKKLLRKRVNARKNRLNKFLEINLFLFKDYIKETLELSTASGKFSSLDKMSQSLDDLVQSV